MSLRLKLKEKVDEAATLREKMKARLSTGEPLSDEDRTTYETEHERLLLEAKKLKADIEFADSLANHNASEFDQWLPKPNRPKTQRDDNLAKTGQHLNANDDPARGFKTQREYFRAVMLASHPNGPQHLDPQGRAVAGYDERLGTLRSRAMLTAGSDEASTISGEWYIPPAFHPDLLMVKPLFPEMKVTAIPMESPKVDIPARVDKDHTSSVSGGLTVTRRVETSQMSGSRLKTEPISLVASGQYGLAYITEELLNDSPLSIAAIIEASFSTEFESQTVYERIWGGGSGEFLGVMNAPCLITIDKESGQTAATVVYNNILKMRAQCWGFNSAIWLYNPELLPQLAVMTVGSLNWPVWMPSAREGEPDRILGRPAYPTEYCAALGTTGDIILGDWQEYLEGTYQGMNAAESIHVRFEWNERVYRFYRRNAAAPWWKTTLTPKKGTKTYSPFVCVQTRS